MKCLSDCVSGQTTEYSACHHSAQKMMMICALEIYNLQKEFLLKAREWPVRVKKHSLKTNGKITLTPCCELELTTGVCVCACVWVSSCHEVSYKSHEQDGQGKNRTDQLLSSKHSKLDHQSRNTSGVMKTHFVFFFSASDKIKDTQIFMTLAINWETQITTCKRQKIELSCYDDFSFWYKWRSSTEKRVRSMRSSELLSFQTKACPPGEHTTTGCGPKHGHDIISKGVEVLGNRCGGHAQRPALDS